MINGFEEYTKPLNEHELTVFLPPIIEGLRLKVGKKRAVTNKEIIRGLYINRGITIDGAQVRKVINYVRCNNLVPCLIATSKGYYIAETPQEVDEYIASLQARSKAIQSVVCAMQRQMNQRWE